MGMGGFVVDISNPEYEIKLRSLVLMRDKDSYRHNVERDVTRF